MLSARTSTGARRNGAVIVAALTVAAVAVGVAAISLPPDGDDSDARPAAAMSSTSDPTEAASVLPLDHGPTDDSDAVAACAGDDFADDLDDVEVLYDVTQEAPDGTTPVLVLRNPDGELRLCDMAGQDAPASSPLPEPDAGHPVAHLTNGQQIWDCDGTVLTSFRATTWLGVTSEVAEVGQRFVVDGNPGPWFSTSPMGGIAHLQVWLGPQVEGTRISLQQRVLDADGHPVAKADAPAQRIVGCRGGGDAQIG